MTFADDFCAPPPAVGADDREGLRQLRRAERVPADSPLHQFMHRCSQEALRITAQINSGYHRPETLRALFSQLIGRPVDEDFALFPPFYTDCGKNIALGRGVFINAGCCFQDQGGITIGDGALIGHRVVLATLNHDLCPRTRRDLLPAPIAIGPGAWLGSGATVLPGVTIGAGAVVAAGAVVTRDVPANTVVAGVPAAAVKLISEEEFL